MKVEDNHEPLVSVLMNCYNGEKYLREALDSVLAQTYQNWELIFWDNQSTDSTAEILSTYLEDSRIRYYYAPTHTDLGGGRAAAWYLINGDYLGILDVDDVWDPQKLERQVRVMQANPAVGICISNTRFFSESYECDLYKVSPPVELGVGELINRYYISLESVLISMKHASNLEEGFSPDFSHIADFDLLVRLANKSEIYYLDDVLSYWRVHIGSGTWSENEKFSIELLRWVEKYYGSSQFKEYSNNLSKLEKRERLVLASALFCDGNFRSSLKMLKPRRTLYGYLYSVLSVFKLPAYILIAVYKRHVYRRRWFA